MWSTGASLVPIFLEALLEQAWLVRGNLPLHVVAGATRPRTRLTPAALLVGYSWLLD